MKKVSAGIMCWNEVRSIEAAIESALPFADQIVVLDRGSNDGTWELLNELRSSIKELRIFSKPQNGGRFCEQYNESLNKNLIAKMCSNDTVLLFDADELLWGTDFDVFRRAELPVSMIGYNICGDGIYISQFNGVKWATGRRVLCFNRNVYQFNPEKRRHATVVAIGKDDAPQVLWLSAKPDTVRIFHVHPLVKQDRNWRSLDPSIYKTAKYEWPDPPSATKVKRI